MNRDLHIILIAVVAGVVVWFLTERQEQVVLARGDLPPEGLAGLSGPAPTVGDPTALGPIHRALDMTGF